MIDIARLFLHRTIFAGCTSYDLVMLVFPPLSLPMRLPLRSRVRVLSGRLGAYVTNGFGRTCFRRPGCASVAGGKTARAQRLVRGLAFWHQEQYLFEWHLLRGCVVGGSLCGQRSAHSRYFL